MTVKSFDETKDKRDRLQNIETPVLILRGQCDNQSWGFTEEYLKLLPNSSLEIIDNSGHDLINGNRERYYTLVNEFLNNPVGIHLNQFEKIYSHNSTNVLE